MDNWRDLVDPKDDPRAVNRKIVMVAMLVPEPGRWILERHLVASQPEPDGTVSSLGYWRIGIEMEEPMTENLFFD